MDTNTNVTKTSASAIEEQKIPVRSQEAPTWGLYIHIPFCKQACHYCDFHFSTAMAKKDRMVFALCNEIKLRRKEVPDYSVIETIYFGGGTPTVLTVPALEFIIDTIYENYLVTDDVEITVEANPDDLNLQTIQKLAKF